MLALPWPSRPRPGPRSDSITGKFKNASLTSAVNSSSGSGPTSWRSKMSRIKSHPLGSTIRSPACDNPFIPDRSMSAINRVLTLPSGRALTSVASFVSLASAHLSLTLAQLPICAQDDHPLAASPVLPKTPGYVGGMRHSFGRSLRDLPVVIFGTFLLCLCWRCGWVNASGPYWFVDAQLGFRRRTTLALRSPGPLQPRLWPTSNSSAIQLGPPSSSRGCW